MLCGLPPFFHHEMPAADRKRIGECDIQVEQVLGPPGIYNRYLYIYSIRNFTTDIDTNKVKGHKWHVLHPHARTKACMGRLIRRSEKERSQNDHLMVARIPLSATTKCCNCYTP